MKWMATTLYALAILACSIRVGADGPDRGAAAAVEQHIQQHAEALGGEQPLRRRLSEPFDFDGLRESDVAVVYWIGVDNDTTAFLAVFESSNGAWSLTYQVRLGGRGLRHITGVEYSEHLISIECLEFAGHEPLSSPSLRVKIKASVRKGLLMLERELREE
ncbi:MAG: hypothetical protein AAGB26_16230 [Planctomycetota bacterium]